jgi:20S proteasome alpha/beta subunit
MSLGARSQSAKTYLERRLDEYKDEEDLEKVVLHGLYALRETLQQGKEVSIRSRGGISTATMRAFSDEAIAFLSSSSTLKRSQLQW